MKKIKKAFGAVLIVLLLCAAVPSVLADGTQETTILFTHDLHSHFLPREKKEGGESGGYARLKTLLDRERKAHPDALVLDGGDFSIGSLLHTLYTTEAAELRTMGALGIDVTTAGNHEFDHTGTGFGQMLNAAVLSGDRVPAMVMSNYAPAADNPDKLDIQRAMAAYGVQDHLLIERGGVTYGIFGLIGVDAHNCMPTSGFTMGDQVDNAQRCVDALREEGAQFIICLSHSGTDETKKKSEDERLAEEVDGIDLILSGHSHTLLTEPIVVGDTYIVSAGNYCQNLGSITLKWNEGGEKTLVEYELIPVDETVSENSEIVALVDSWKMLAGGAYLSRYDLTYDQVLTTTAFDMDTPQYGIQQGNGLGDLVADAFRWAAQNLEKDAPDVPVVTLTAAGVLRAPLIAGPITVSEAFDVLSIGMGSDGTSGFPLVGVYLTGRELKAAAEVDASVTPIMPDAQLYMSGIRYSFNTHRMFFNRITDADLVDVSFGADSGPQNTVELKDDQLYRVVGGMYSAQMLGTVKAKSFGLLSLEPKMADGSPVTDFNACILYDENGNEIKEWYALAAYLQQFGEEGVPSRYDQLDGRKDVSRSWNPVELLKNLNWLSLVALLVLLVVVAVMVYLVRCLMYARKRRRYGAARRSRSRFRR